MKIGYPCINLSLPCRSSRTFRLASYSDKRMQATVEGNLDCLLKTLQFNARHDISFFRITSDLIPFASHPVCTFAWKEIFADRFAEIGKFIRQNHMRVSMHPDQFVLINSLDQGIFERSVKELEYHADVLDLLGTETAAKIQIHVGGVYNDKEKSIERFVSRYELLPKKIKTRLVIENDERLYDLSDCLKIHRETGIPVVFDVFHFRCNNSGEDLRSAMENAFMTWTRKDGIPVVDFSTQEKDRRTGAHAGSIDKQAFRKFIQKAYGMDFDIMLEIKDKEKSALTALNFIRKMGML